MISRRLAVLGLLSLCSVPLRVVAAPGEAAAKPITILPLGDSITEGGKTFSVYRVPLRQKLIDGGHVTEYVGSKTGESKLGPLKHEGYGGKTVEFLAQNIEKLYQANPADIVLLHAGHNHTVEEKPIAGILKATEMIVTKIHAIRKDAKIIVAQVIPSGKLPKYSYIADLNVELAKLVQRLAADGHNVTLVDQATGFDWQTDTIADKVHPNERGAEKMAAAWYMALVKVLPEPTKARRRIAAVAANFLQGSR